MLNTVSAYIRNVHFSSERALLPSWDRVLCQVQEWQGIHSGRPDVFTRKSSMNERKINSTEYVLTRFNELVQRQLAFCSKRVYLSHLCFCSLSLGNQLLAHTMIVLVQVIDFQVKMSKS